MSLKSQCLDTKQRGIISEVASFVWPENFNTLCQFFGSSMTERGYGFICL